MPHDTALIATIATMLIIMLGKSLAAFCIVLLFRYPVHTALTVSASLAQIGAFSFILAGLGLTLGLLPPEGQSLILAGAIISITLNPVTFSLVAPIERWLRDRPRLLDALERPTGALERPALPFVAIEQNRESAEALRHRGLPVRYGDAARAGTLELAHVERARLLVIATPDAYQSRRIIELARKANPQIEIVARTHSEAEQRYLERQGVGMAVMGERELALGMARYALRALDLEPDEADVIVRALRTRAGGDAPAGDDAERTAPSAMAS